MTRTRLLSLSAVVLFVPLLVRGQAAPELTVDEIIAKNIQARGGLEKLKAVQTIRISGRVSQGDFRARYLTLNLRPDKVREEFIIQGMAEIEAYDGKTGWRVSPFEGRKDPDRLSADDMKGLVEEADIDGQLVDYKNKDHRAELMGHESVEGTDCYKIKLTLANGDVHYYYIDTDSFMELKMETERTVRGTVQYSEAYYGDYEEVNGVYFPFALEQGQKGSSFRTKMTVDKVEVNVPISESTFTIPAGGAK